MKRFDILKIFVILITGILSFTTARENVPTKDELLHTIPQLRNIPGFTEFETSSVEIQAIEKLLREKCERNGGPTAFNAAKEGAGLFSTCLHILVNVRELQSEIAETQPYGELDVVFKKYCRRVPNLKNCVKNLTDTMEPCLDMDERESVKIVHNITSSLLEFICHNEGDRIAMFIAAGGIDCFAAEYQAVADCAKKTFGRYIPASETAGDAFPMLTLALKDCNDMDEFKTCAVEAWGRCLDPTPANLLESLINFVERKTPCHDMQKKTTERSPPTVGEQIPSDTIGSVVNSHNSSVEIGNADEISVKQKCEKYDEPVTYDDLKHKVEIFNDYITSLGAMTQIVTGIVTTIPQGNLDTVLEEKCVEASAVKGYLEKITNSVAHCVQPEMKNSVNSIYNLTSSILKFICKDRCYIPRF